MLANQDSRCHIVLLVWFTERAWAACGITTYGQMAFNTKLATTQREIQGAATLNLFIIEKENRLKDML